MDHETVLGGAANPTEDNIDTINRIVNEEEVLRIGERALADQQSVIARDATPVTPVEHHEVSRILAKRLFEAIDDKAAREAAAEYAAMYDKNRSLLYTDHSNAQIADAENPQPAGYRLYEFTWRTLPEAIQLSLPA